MATTHYLWDRLENNVAGEFDGSGNVVASYVTKPNLYGDVMSQRRADSGARYYHKDALGTVTELTDQDGNVTDTFRATAFGETVESTGSTVSPFKYVGSKGYYNDNGLSSLTVRRRRYSPNTARWLSVDPLSHMIPLDSRTPAASDFSGEFMDHMGPSPLLSPGNRLNPNSITRHLTQRSEYVAPYCYLSANPLSGTDPSGLWKGSDDVLLCISLSLAATGGLGAQWIAFQAPMIACFYSQLLNLFIDEGKTWKNRDFAHCVVSCRASKVCGHYISALAGLQKEFIDCLDSPFFSWKIGTADWKDLIADYDGIKCAGLLESWAPGIGIIDVCQFFFGSSCWDCCAKTHAVWGGRPKKKPKR